MFTTAIKRGVAPHTHKQKVLAAISKLRSTFLTGYKVLSSFKDRMHAKKIL